MWAMMPMFRVLLSGVCLGISATLNQQLPAASFQRQTIARSWELEAGSC
jgi:hypothetical protein